ncbi:AraC family transcriptional regulator [Paenibacillus sp. J5C_2022]|uniref:helix-turn-helix transcriptional regulator n=1 Tax=Paenibacillus sp. J5C2022 TaxID=2977129 RepID=UPI0021D38185|nr:AraC family transcriptional regulator [Paenibacillus sp. J5C2022]MCU6707496.1 AraC family transcriptional regulator [Paenibacillus sp. J5C2022]
MERQIHLLTLPQSPYFCMPESIGHYYDHPEHHVYRSKDAINNFNIHYVLSGKGYVEVEGEIHTLSAGHAVLYFPRQEQHYYSSKDDPWNIRWFHFYGDGMRDYLVQQGMHLSQLWTLRQPQQWERAHEKLLAEGEQHRMLRPLRLSSLTYQLLALFLEQAVPLRKGSGGEAGSRILELLPAMQQQATEPFELHKWAELAGVSTHYFCKLFRSAMEMTPVAFITRCRLQMAKQWLLDRKTASIGDIAKEAGYPSVSYFNKRFMEHEGMTPSEYRQLYAAGGGARRR